MRSILNGAVLALLLMQGTLLAGSGSRTTVPMGKAKSGLRIVVDTTWVDANGYRPIQFEVIPVPAGPSLSDRTIRVEIEPYSFRGGFGWCGVTDYIELPQGATSAQATISVPQSEQWTSCKITFYEDGSELEDLALNTAMSFTGNYGWTEASPAMLFIDSDAPSRALRQTRIAELRQLGSKGNSYLLPDVRGLAEMHPPPDLTRVGYNPDEPATDMTLLDGLASWSKIEILPPSDLSAKWIEYTGLDLVFISWDELQSMVKQNPAQWQAIRDLISTGPTLCVYNAGEDFARLAEMEKLLNVRPLAEDAESKPFRGWATPVAKDFSRTVTQTQAINNQYVYNSYTKQPAVNDATNVETQKLLNEREGKAPAKPGFVWRPVELGRVVAIAAENPFPGRPQEWGWILNSIDEDDWMWQVRHGVSLNRRNLDYWQFLIPGVGMAPINSFLVLISLFVVVIGPINYWILVRQGRLYLLLVTVPAGALIVTMSLFGYALVTDGVGVKARMRSYTEIDQRRGRSVSWSRQSYYAGMSPSKGMQFPETAAIYPIEVEPNNRIGYRSPKYNIDWEEGQSLDKGFIASRVTSQMMVVQARATEAKVDIKEIAGGPPQATNRLGVPVEYFAMRGADGKFYSAANLAAGKAATLAPTEWVDIADRVRNALAKVKPANPKGYDPRQHNEALNFGSSNYYGWGYNIDSTLGEPSVTTSILERSLRELGSSQAVGLAPRSYVVIAPRSPEVPFGLEKITQMESIHVIVGKW